MLQLPWNQLIHLLCSDWFLHTSTHLSAYIIPRCPRLRYFHLQNATNSLVNAFDEVARDQYIIVEKCLGEGKSGVNGSAWMYRDERLSDWQEIRVLSKEEGGDVEQDEDNENGDENDDEVHEDEDD